MNNIKTLDQFTRIGDLIRLLDDPLFSNLYILYLKYRDIRNKANQDDRSFHVKNLIRIAKVNVISKYVYGWLKDRNVDWVQHGPIVEEQYPALNTLHKQGLIQIEEVISDDKFSYLFKITDDGIKLIEENLRKIDIDTNFSIKVPFEDEIINLLKLENDELVNIATENFGRANALDVKNIGEFKIIQIFDWTRFGDGNWKKCYDSLLWSLQSLNESGRFRNRDAKLFGFSYESLDEAYYFKPKREETLKSIFQKSLPPVLGENKIEGKNCIINLWYILEAVNIFHAIIGLCPNVDDIARMCLLTYKHEAAKSNRKKDTDKLRHLRESTLRKDIDKLVGAGLLKIGAKDGKKYLYRINSLKYIYCNEEYNLCDPVLIRNKYMQRKQKERILISSILKTPIEKADFNKNP